MPQVSSKKKDKIAEQITHFLFESSPDSKFTSEIAESIARDEEFTKAILQDLEKKKIIVSIDKNPNGKDYSRRRRWRLSNEAYEIYSKHQQAPTANRFPNSQDSE